MAAAARPSLMHFDPHALLVRVRGEQGGFLTRRDVTMLAGDERARLWQILIRCGGCRLTCAAQDVEHLIAIISKEGTDYVRDIGLIAGVVYA